MCGFYSYLSNQLVLPVVRFGCTTGTEYFFETAGAQLESLNEEVIQPFGAPSLAFQVESEIIVWTDPSAATNSQ